MELSPGMEVWKGNMDQMELSMGPKDQMELSMGPGASACLCLSYIHTLIELFHKKHGLKSSCNNSGGSVWCLSIFQ